MSTKQTKPRLDRLWEYDRGMLRSAFVSVFWAVIKAKSLTLQWIADKLGIDKSAVSRWFGGQHPNWTIDTIADLAHVLDLEIEVTARDRTTGARYTVHGAITSTRQTASLDFSYGGNIFYLWPQSQTSKTAGTVANDEGVTAPAIAAE